MKNEITKEDVMPFMLKVAKEHIAKVMLANSIVEMLKEK